MPANCFSSPYRGSAPGPHWGTPLGCSPKWKFLSPPMLTSWKGNTLYNKFQVSKPTEQLNEPRKTVFCLFREKWSWAGERRERITRIMLRIFRIEGPLEPSRPPPATGLSVSQLPDNVCKAFLRLGRLYMSIRVSWAHTYSNIVFMSTKFMLFICRRAVYFPRRWSVGISAATAGHQGEVWLKSTSSCAARSQSCRAQRYASREGSRERWHSATENIVATVRVLRLWELCVFHCSYFCLSACLCVASISQKLWIGFRWIFTVRAMLARY